MAEHEVTEAMVDAALKFYVDNGPLRGLRRIDVRGMLEEALAARTTPQPTDASAASGTITVCSRNEPTGPPWCAVADWDAERRCYVTRDPMYGHPTGAGADADWVLVPRNPTPEMLRYAGMMSGYDPHSPQASPDADHVGWWHSMLDAALASSPQQRAGDEG